MAVTALFRIRGGEVLKISTKGQPFADRNQTYFGVLADPTLPDGASVRERREDGTLGPMRVVGYAQIADSVGNACRLATQAEVDAWPAAEQADDNLLDGERVAQYFTAHPIWRKAFKALLTRILQVTNAHAETWNEYRAQVAASVSLADFKARVAAMDDLPTPTLAQAIAALLNDINSDD